MSALGQQQPVNIISGKRLVSARSSHSINIPKDRKFYRVELLTAKISALKPIHASPTDIIQRVIRLRNRLIGNANLKTAKTIIGAKQMIVLIVQAEKVIRPCRFLRVFLSKGVLSVRHLAGILA
jgi:hypothetical protein